jgi:hypothetical protein
MIPIWTKAIKYNRPDTVQADAIYRYLRAKLATICRVTPAEAEQLPLLDAGDLIAYDVFTRMNEFNG